VLIAKGQGFVKEGDAGGVEVTCQVYPSLGREWKLKLEEFEEEKETVCGIRYSQVWSRHSL